VTIRPEEAGSVGVALPSSPMGRTPRSVLPDGYFHVYARGVPDVDPFPENSDRSAFVALVRRAEGRFGMAVIAFCVMSSHYHLLVESTQEELSRAMQWINAIYARDFNTRYERFGSVWAERYSCRSIAEDALPTVYAYVRDNPVKAGLCTSPGEWAWTYCKYGFEGSV
jgi:REP-associated tyrosine transposase